MYLERKTHTSVERSGFSSNTNEDDEEVSDIRTTEVSFGQVKWHLTDADGQLNIAVFELRDFFYEKVRAATSVLYYYCIRQY